MHIKPEYVKQEIWAEAGNMGKALPYNITETIINHTVLEKHGATT